MAKSKKRQLTPAEEKRDQLMAAILLRGHATVAEIFQADFGGDWPPKGIDLAVEPKQRVSFFSLKDYPDLGKDYLPNFYTKIKNPRLARWVGKIVLPWAKRKEMEKVWGTTTLHADRKIWMNTSAIQKAGHAVSESVGHETVHIAEGDHYWRKQDISPNPNILTYQLARIAWHDSAVPRAHELLATDMAYLEQGIEIQARLHEILAEGYSTWGRLPGSKQELWAALTGAGLTPPAEVKAEMAWGGSELLVQFFLPQSAVRTAEINAAQISYFAGHEVDFWRKTLPALYGDLLELYGDGPGRARMGLGENPKLTTTWVSYFREGAPYGKADFERWATFLYADQIVDVIDRVVGDIRQDFGQPYDVSFLNVLRAIPRVEEKIRGRKMGVAAASVTPVLVSPTPHQAIRYLASLPWQMGVTVAESTIIYTSYAVENNNLWRALKTLDLHPLVEDFATRGRILRLTARDAAELMFGLRKNGQQPSVHRGLEQDVARGLDKVFDESFTVIASREWQMAVTTDQGNGSHLTIRTKDNPEDPALLKALKAVGVDPILVRSREYNAHTVRLTEKDAAKIYAILHEKNKPPGLSPGLEQRIAREFERVTGSPLPEAAPQPTVSSTSQRRRRPFLLKRRVAEPA